MACPKCGCKVSYEYCNGWDDESHAEEHQRCAACRHVFYIEDSADEDEDDAPDAPSIASMSASPSVGTATTPASGKVGEKT